MAHYEETISSETVFEGRLISLRRDRVRTEDGGEAGREVVVHSGGVAVLALDSGEQVLMVRQFRYPLGREMLEIPAGKLEPGEDPAAAGLRELREEAGVIPRSYRPLGTFAPTPGYVTEVIHVFLAADLERAEQDLDPGEFLTVERIPLDQALEWCRTGELEDGKTLFALLKYAAFYRGRG